MYQKNCDIPVNSCILSLFLGSLLKFLLGGHHLIQSIIYKIGVGLFLLNMQMAGMLLGGILWGVLGDKRGRISVLLGSIFLYSIATSPMVL